MPMRLHNSTKQSMIATRKPNHRIATPRHRLVTAVLAGAMGLSVTLSMTACGRKHAQESVNEAEGSQMERVARITKMLSRSAPLPGPLLDAHFVEEKTGDGQLGPSDFKAFYALTVAAADLPAWKAALSKSKPVNTFSNDAEIKHAAPAKGEPRWVNEVDLGKLEFYSPQSLTGNANGWVGIAADGKIYIHVFTM
jgi:hypothetical protein